MVSFTSSYGQFTWSPKSHSCWQVPTLEPPKTIKIWFIFTKVNLHYFMYKKYSRDFVLRVVSPTFDALDGWDCTDQPQGTWDVLWTGPYTIGCFWPVWPHGRLPLLQPTPILRGKCRLASNKMNEEAPDEE